MSYRPGHGMRPQAQASGRNYAPPHQWSSASHQHASGYHRPGRLLTITTRSFPAELLVNIFEEVMATISFEAWFRRWQSNYFAYVAHGSRTIRDLLPLMAVCRDWRKIICGTPGLWRIIPVNNSPEWLRLCLHRSQQRLIHVVFHSHIPNLQVVLPSLLPHKDRIGTLVFQSLDCSAVGREGLALGPMARLKMLNVNVVHRHAFGTTRCQLLPCPYPRLERLQLLGLTVQPSHRILLRELNIGHFFPGRTTMRLSDFIGFLRACETSLEILQLSEGALAAIDYDLSQGTSPRAVFRELRDLSIVGNVEQVSNMLSHMELTRDAEISLDTDPQEDAVLAGAAVRAILPSEIGTWSPASIMHSATRIRVEVPNDCSNAVSITATKGMDLKNRLNITVNISQAGNDAASLAARRDYFHKALARLPSMFPNAPLDTLVCCGMVRDVSEETWRSLCSSFPRLKTLVVYDTVISGNVAPLWRALMSPQSPQDARPICPRLENVWLSRASGELREAAILQQIQACLEWRIAHRVPLRQLRLEGLAWFYDGTPQHVPPDMSQVVVAYRGRFAQLVRQSTLEISDFDNPEHVMEMGDRVDQAFPFSIYD